MAHNTEHHTLEPTGWGREPWGSSSSSSDGMEFGRGWGSPTTYHGAYDDD